MSDEGQCDATIVQATASMTSHGTVGSEAAIGRRIQEAMTAALVDAQARGVTDVDELRAVQLAARDAVLGL